MARDSLGNELKPGQLVLLQLNSPIVSGRVAAIERGGIVTGLRKGGDEVRPDRLVIVANFTIELDPRNPIATSVMSLLDPHPPDPQAIEKVIESVPDRRLDS